MAKGKDAKVERRGLLRAAVYGAAVGDALGVPYEFLRRGEFECAGMVGGGAHGQVAGTWSDDTSMILATCDSIRAKRGRIDVADMRRRFCDWAHKGRYTPHGVCFDIGNATSTALYEGVGCKGERSNGNGSLMRIVPLAFAGATDEEVAAVSAITHAHRVSTEACVAYVRIARVLADGSSPEEAVRDHAPTGHPFERVASVGRLGVNDIESDGYVVHTLEASLWCLLSTGTYAECVTAAVNLGRDSDTTACVAGALAGIVYGLEAIPPEWMECLIAKDLIERCLF